MCLYVCTIRGWSEAICVCPVQTVGFSEGMHVCVSPNVYMVSVCVFVCVLHGCVCVVSRCVCAPCMRASMCCELVCVYVPLYVCVCLW